MDKHRIKMRMLGERVAIFSIYESLDEIETHSFCDLPNGGMTCTVIRASKEPSYYFFDKDAPQIIKNAYKLLFGL